MAWLRAVEGAKGFEELESYRRRWDDLDSALAAAIVGVARRPLQRELLLYQERRSKAGFALTGRSALWHVYQRFSLERGHTMRVDLNTLCRLEFKGDLEACLSACDYTLMSMVNPPDSDMLLSLSQGGTPSTLQGACPRLRGL